ncbi:hypothetical protein [Staphylococcus succinus]|uniref:hypothetical protein n=1 Tax=Staphylococcus succinus TaxID=61015 RepID=UPI001C04C423|nr:hypothetical protein [Staphylococcus succinus]MBU0437798.1 hypothetical protein [Staphylococcus succinus]
MQLRETLLSSNPEVLLEVDYDLPIKAGGYYLRDEIDPDGLITITGKVDYYIQNGILAEELGHHETTSGNILNAYSYSNEVSIISMKEELKARRRGYELAVPLQRLIDCYVQGVWGNVYDMCLSMGIDRSYFKQVIEDYKVKYGPFVEYNGYIINFMPLDIEKA